MLFKDENASRRPLYVVIDVSFIVKPEWRVKLKPLCSVKLWSHNSALDAHREYTTNTQYKLSFVNLLCIKSDLFTGLNKSYLDIFSVFSEHSSDMGV